MKLHTIFNTLVYTDICEATIVGDTQYQLLRAVAVSDGHWKSQCTIYDRPQYVRVNRKHIGTISLYIYTDYGKKVPFTHGRTVVTLNLRRVQPFSLI